jgi:hypothetical protein
MVSKNILKIAVVILLVGHVLREIVFALRGYYRANV